MEDMNEINDQLDEIEVEPQFWPTVAPHRVNRGPLGTLALVTPGVVWRTRKTGGGGMDARINATGSLLFMKIVATSEKEEDPDARIDRTNLGLIVRQGIGKDVGKFALQPATYIKFTNLRVTRTGSALQFQPASLMEFIPPNGNSRLTVVGNLLVASATGQEFKRVTSKTVRTKRRILHQ